MHFYLALTCDTILPDLYKGLRTGDSCSELKAIDNFDAIKQLLLNGVQILIAVAGLVAVGFIIFGGIQYIMSQGQPEHIKKAKETLVNAAVGLFLVILSYVIVGLIAGALTSTIS